MLAINIPSNISQILKEIKVEGEIVRADNSDHCTLFYFEDGLKIDDILKIIPVVIEIVKKINGFNIGIDNYSSFPEGKYGFPIISKIKNNDLMKLRNKISKAFDENDIKYSKKFEFTPHITLQYNEEKQSGKFEEIIWPIKNVSLYCGDSNKEKLYIEFPFEGHKEKYSSDFIYELSDHFEKLASL